MLKAVVLILSLSLVCVFAAVGNEVMSESTRTTPVIEACNTQLSDIKQKMQLANEYRQACEKSFFSSSACDSYWTYVNQILTLQINYQDCGRQTQNQFYADVRSNIATEGSNTRNTDTSNAAATQKVVKDQAEATRGLVTSEADRTIKTVNDKTHDENTETRTRVSTEASTTRDLITTEHTKTDKYINDNTTTIVQTTVNQAQATRAEVDAQHTATKTLLTTTIQNEGLMTRKNTDDEAQTTRETISTEAAATRVAINVDGKATRDVVEAQADKTRTNTTNEAATTRAHVTTQHGLTRDAITAAKNDIKTKVQDTSKATQDLLVAQGGATRDTITAQAANTNGVVQNAFNANTASLNTLQSSQNNFTTLFVQILIMMDFSSSNARVDLFQRPASQGGYFEVMRTLVRNVIDTNKGYYSWTSYKVGLAESRWDDGERAYAKTKPDYRSAWEYYRSAYLLATSSS